MNPTTEKSGKYSASEVDAEVKDIRTRFFDSVSHLAIIKDPSLRYVCVNEPFLKVLGLDSPSDIIGKNNSEILKGLTTEEHINQLLIADHKASNLPTGKHVEAEIVINTPEKDCTFSSKKFPIRDDSGNLLGIGILTCDVSEKKTKEKKFARDHKKLTRKIETQADTLRAANKNLQFMEHVFQNTLDGIIITDNKGQALQINPAFTEITGYTLDEIRGKNPRILKSDYHDENFYKEMWNTLAENGTWEGELWNRHKSGEIYPQRLSISAIHNSEGIVTHYVGVNNDISELKRKEEKIHFYAYHDVLTNLPNRKLFSDRLRLELEKAGREGYQVALLYMDIDDFKKVNDSLGYTIGDELLKQISKRIKTLLDDSDIFARLGSDEFAVAQVDIRNINNVITLAQKINGLTIKPFMIEGHEIFINSSMGISIFPDDTDCPEQLILHADTAMHQIKGTHLEHFRFYTSQMKIEAQHKIDMESAIRKGLMKGEFIPFYQAKVSCKTGGVVGMEALARWVKADGKIISPVDFIPLAEELNLIHEIDTRIITSAVRDMAEWEKAGHNELVVSANISATELEDPAFVDTIFSILEDNNVAKEKFELEVTESLIMKDVEKNAQILEKLCTSGINCSIDDFGTGYSSLSYLKKLPIKTLKIDRSFVNDIMTDHNDLAIVCAIISMARRMGLKVVAEGVEDADQVELLKKEGCDIIQGYYYSKPLSKKDFLDFINLKRDRAPMRN
ncbi:sensor domain-containing protein [Maridesulfovibrio hydrothermalis]|uniref:Putative Diguanylate cyclase n=1 Tax=Maridesulfovibrio hydrothermalis AM13 = DSM 14728 TaxID=1121451 RepID=L0RF82_9BACT|nr:bifunctional diguanylate cyclase/phosphodiesterase [Maridesulfovibrio hydrothermalis]CCO24872.1 putative Diguanylate cyclase [Maridesulfovibrio hydrothermalis AM13 = DSM 14728]